MEALRATYRLRVAERDVEARVEALALEQTVELPRSAVRDPFVEKEILPRWEALDPDPEGGFRVTVVFPEATTAGDPAQLLNVLFGNSSLQEDVSLLDVSLPPALANGLGGPRLGIAGFRELVGVSGRPLTCTALKPMGLAPEVLAELCAAFVRSGVDVVKDDHGLADFPFAPFEARVAACQAEVERETRRTGRRALYAPNLIGTPRQLWRQLEFARERGVRAVLLAPMLLGLPVLQDLVREAPGVAILAHPALGGTVSIAPEVLLGTLFRAFGADAVIYPHAGGRFGFRLETCGHLADRLRAPAGGLRPALPVPAGGMSLERVGELVSFYGRDAMLLVGGSLYAAGSALEERAREFVANVARAVDALREEGAT